MMRIYLNEIGAPEGEWSLDYGEGSVEMNFDSIHVSGGIWQTRTNPKAPEGTPKAWLECSGARSMETS